MRENLIPGMKTHCDGVSERFESERMVGAVVPGLKAEKLGGPQHIAMANSLCRSFVVLVHM